MSFLEGEHASAREPRSVDSAVGVAEVTHDLIRGQLSDYLDGSIDARDRDRIDEHLARCSACRAHWATFRATVESVSALPRAQAPASAKERLRQITEA